MSEREYENALALLASYDKWQAMIATVLSERKRLSGIVPAPPGAFGTNSDPMTRGFAAAILSQLGFDKESAEMLRTPEADEKGMPNLYDLPILSDSSVPSLFRGIPQLDPLFRPKDLPPPTPAQIRGAIENIERVTALVAKNLDAMVGQAKLELSPSLLAKFAVSVRAIEMY